MFTAKLFDFQTKHEESLLAKCADHEGLVLSAPTGAGKTVLISKFIDDYLDENPNTVFLWLCPVSMFSEEEIAFEKEHK